MLGISLSNIKALQKGSERFLDILSHQITVLEGQIKQNQKAAQVCRHLKQSGVGFVDIDSKYYLEMLNAQSDRDTGHYNDSVITEHHPIRRFLARYIDLTIFCGFVQFLLVVILRIRPWSNPLAIFVQYASLSTISKGEDLPWDEETEVIYTNWDIRRKISLSGVILAVVIMIYGASTGAALPKYRESMLTPEEFNENYKHYETMFKISDQYSLQPDGSWKEYSSENSEVVITSRAGEYNRAPFEYTLSDGKIVEIRYQDQWSDLSFSPIMPNYCICAVYAAIGSSPEIKYKELIRAGEDFSYIFTQQFDGSVLKDHFTGNYLIEGIEISWEIQLENVEYIVDEQLFSSNGAGVYSLDMVISFAG